ncbi:uncharacterized protein LOC144471506 [Augochlora pura]
MIHMLIRFPLTSLNTRTMIKMSKQRILQQYIKLCLSTKSKTHYDTLEISPNATSNEIKSAYYKLTLEYHPDRNKSDQAKVRFQNISDAYQVLSNFQLRKQYDRTIAIKYADIDKIQRTETAYSEKTMGRMYDYDEWLRAHYGRSFERRKAQKEQYAEYMHHRKQIKEINEERESSIKVAIVLSIIILIVLYITDRNVLKYDQPKPDND